MTTTPRARFAPSPSGRMHLGNLFAALLAWLDIRALGGEMLLRMEDLDPDRCKPAYLDQLADDLDWLGLDWDLGWQAGDRSQNETYQQSHRTAQYEAAFETLAHRGLVYPCFCTRKELLAASAPHASDGARVYNGHCRSLSAQEKTALLESGRRPAWRIKVPAEVISFVDGNFGPQQQKLETECGDFILRRSDGVYAYQLAVVVDDAAGGVTEIVRGADLLRSTPRQLWLQTQLGLPHPHYYHVPLLCAPDGRRLSKREHDLDLGVLRQTLTAGQLLGKLAFLAGLLDRPEAASAAELTREFDWTHVFTKNIFVNSVFFHR